MTRTERFWKRVTKLPNGCWEHAGAPGSHGYSQFGGDVAHRESWRIHFGDIPEGLMVLHKCHNKRCIRPSHLKLGTHQDNMDDMSMVGHPRRGLSARDVREIRRSKKTQRALAERFGVSVRVKEKAAMTTRKQKPRVYRFVIYPRRSRAKKYFGKVRYWWRLVAPHGEVMCSLANGPGLASPAACKRSLNSCAGAFAGLGMAISKDVEVEILDLRGRSAGKKRRA